MTKKLVALRIRVEKAIEGRLDAGQGSLEYVGAILVAAVVIGLVIAAFRGLELRSKVSDAVDRIFNN